MTRICSLFSFTIFLTAAACGTGAAEPPSGGGSGGSGGSGPTAAKSGTTGPGSSCQFEVKGDLTANVSATGKRTGDPNMSAGTDYWLTDEDLRRAIKTITGLGSKRSAAEEARAVEDGMKKDPRLVVLLMSCGTDADGMVILGSGSSPYADMPFGPGKYDIVSRGKTGKQVSLMFSLKQGGKHYYFNVTEPGVLHITQFDGAKLAGTFAFKAKADDKTVEVTGKFEYPCSGSKCTK